MAVLISECQEHFNCHRHAAVLMEWSQTSHGLPSDNQAEPNTPEPNNPMFAGSIGGTRKSKLSLCLNKGSALSSASERSFSGFSISSRSSSSIDISVNSSNSNSEDEDAQESLLCCGTRNKIAKLTFDCPRPIRNKPCKIRHFCTPPPKTTYISDDCDEEDDNDDDDSRYDDDEDEDDEDDEEYGIKRSDNKDEFDDEPEQVFQEDD